MRERPDRRRQTTSELEQPKGATKRDPVAERCEAHRRWIADDDDTACRGFD